MTVDIYIDILFVINFIINSLIIVLSGVLLRFRMSLLRIALGAAVLALYGVLMFYPPAKPVYSVVGRIAFTLAFVTIYYKSCTLMSAVKAFAAFMSVSFLFFGFIFIYAYFGGSGVLVSNGVPYADISVIKLLTGSALAYGAAAYFIRLSNRNMSRSRIIYEAEIRIDDMNINAKILCDTGCELTEPLSDNPVILLDNNFAEFKIGNSRRYTGINTASGNTEIPLIKPSEVKIVSGRQKLDAGPCYIGIAKTKFTRDGLYNAIANPAVFNCIENSKHKNILNLGCIKMNKHENHIRYKNLIKKIVDFALITAARLRRGGSYYIGGNDTLPAPYSKEEESYWIGKLADPVDGDNAARKLTEHNLRLVVYIAKKFDSTGIGIEDLISIGTIGLIKAINTFKPEKNIKLATYASRCIENEILMYLRKNNGGKNEVSIDEPLNVDWDGNELLLSDILGTDSDVTQKNLEEETDRKLLRLAMDKLSGRERNIVELRFGINRRGEEKTQKEVADMLGISQSYISRLEKRIIGRLRRDMNRMING